MFDDEIGYGVIVALVFLCAVGWIAFISTNNEKNDMITELPTGCILYEDKIWCEVNDNGNK